ncbi:hypothetical protein [Arcobacter sp. CECT 8985]|uniref:hypothetical protein n=1 Tax=Arcobacter sp. CECT 8985 TaxID=1935424 RepID=UPI00100AA03E|nr:hypothetical protein [Arcobacter sp. CECT 8985]RXJ83877.1 hypothetical protein CRU93_13245 [Arcobacter sp. CECT 8985]
MSKNILFITLLTYLFIGCASAPTEEKWTSWVYPDKTQTKRVIKNGVFNSLKECKDASIKKISALNLENKADYKCGLNCNYNKDLKTDVCQKMSK